MSLQGKTRLLLAGLAVGAGLLWLAMRHSDWHRVWQAVLASDWHWMGLAWLAGAAFMWAKAWRWQRLLRPLHAFSFYDVHAAIYAGTAANLVLPHSGELLRASLMGMKAHRPASPLLTTVAVERVLDFLALAVLAVIGLALTPHSPKALQLGAAAAAGLAALGLLLMWAWLKPTALMRTCFWWLLSHLPRSAAHWLHLQLQRGSEGLTVAGSIQTWLWLWLLSVAQWSCVVLAIAASAAAVAPLLSVAACILIFVLMVLGLTLPSPPVQVGATQLAYVFGFQWAGHGVDAALAASLVYTAVVLGWMLAVGLIAGFANRWARPGKASQAAA